MDFLTWFIIFFLIFIITSAIRKVLAKNRENYFLNELQAGQFDKFYQDVESFYTRLLFPKYNLEYLKLNAYIMQDNKEKIDVQFDQLIKLAIYKNQRVDILHKAFEYYVYQEDKKNCDKIMDKIKILDVQELNDYSSMMYDIVISKSTDYIEEMEEDFDSLSKVEKVQIAYLLSIQYKNKGDNKKAKYYENISKSIVEGK